MSKVHVFAAICALSLVLFSGSFAQEKKGLEPEKKAGLATEKLQKVQVLKMRDLIGYSVENPGGEKFGKVDDLVIEPEQGRIAYAVMSFGGVLGIGDKLVAVPWHMLKANAKKKAFTLHATAEELKAAPALDMEKLPSVAPPFTSAGKGKEEQGKRKSEEAPPTSTSDRN